MNSLVRSRFRDLIVYTGNTLRKGECPSCYKSKYCIFENQKKKTITIQNRDIETTKDLCQKLTTVLES